MSSDEQAIRQLVTSWMEASKAGDSQKVLSLMADDVLFLVPGQPPFGKEAFVAAQSGQAAVEVDGTSEIQEVQVLGDWACLRNKLTVVVTPKNGGPAVKRAGHTLSILKKQNGAWVLYRDANLMAVVPQ